MDTELNNNLAAQRLLNGRSLSPLRHSASSSQAASSAPLIATRSPGSSGQHTSETRTPFPAAAQHPSYRVPFDIPFPYRPKLPTIHFFLHSIGLKSFTSKKSFQSSSYTEKKKILILRSRPIALASLGVHLLPSMITILLIALNGVAFVNGPDISTLAKYVLQGTSKLHELTVVGSLTAIIADALRCKIIDEGVSLGLLSSPFSFMGLNFLWSHDFVSAVRQSFPPRSTAPFLLLLVLCCGLAATVGPASALLFLPTQAWLSTGSTVFYLLGTESQLWPQHLSISDLGPDECRGDIPLSRVYCLHGGWGIMRGFVTPEGMSRRKALMGDGNRPRNMFIWRPYSGGTDSWASTTHMATTLLGHDLDLAHDSAWLHAKGRQRRLRDAIEGYLVRIRGRIPIVRAVCGSFLELPLTPVNLAFPVIKNNDYWRRDDNSGPVRDLQVARTSPLNRRVNATWVSLPSEFGMATAGLAYITRNVAGTTVGCGCTIDARWAQGESNTHGQIGSRIWQAMLGEPTLPNGIAYAETAQKGFFEPGMEEYLGETITADIEFLRALTPPAGQESYNNSLTFDQVSSSTAGNYTTLEALLLGSRLSDVPWLLSDTHNLNLEIEALISAYFLNTLSRVGWHMQIDESYTLINRSLRIGSTANDNLLHQNGKNWEKPANYSVSSLEEEWFSYTTAWQLNDPVLYISVAALVLHLIMALVHSVIVVRRGQTSEAWDSITELIALAYNSKPRGKGLVNCGAGIMLPGTLGQKVKVVAVQKDDEENEEEVQLIPCDEVREENDIGSSNQEKMVGVRVGQEYS